MTPSYPADLWRPNVSDREAYAQLKVAEGAALGMRVDLLGRMAVEIRAEGHRNFRQRIFEQLALAEDRRSKQALGDHVNIYDCFRAPGSLGYSRLELGQYSYRTLRTFARPVYRAWVLEHPQLVRKLLDEGTNERDAAAYIRAALGQYQPPRHIQRTAYIPSSMFEAVKDMQDAVEKEMQAQGLPISQNDSLRFGQLLGYIGQKFRTFGLGFAPAAFAGD